MKIKFLTILTISLIILSCSNESVEDVVDNETDIALTNYIYKNYNTSNTPNTVKDSTNYKIENNKILSATGINLETMSQQTITYNYEGDRISEIQSFRDGALKSVQSFSYNTNGELSEYLVESINENSSFQRHVFTHTTDTIFSSWARSDDGVNFDVNVSDSKIVLDENNNRTYFEEYDYFNDETKFEVSTYDSNFNISNESKYLILENGNAVLSFENNYTSNNTENLFNRINEATFTRKNLMLLYHLQSNAVNNINAKSISRNTLTTFQSTWGNSFADFEISNETNANDQTIYSDFRTMISGDVFSRFSQEYIFQ